MSELVALEFEAPSGEALTVEWRSDALAGLDASAEDEGQVWRLAGELDWDEVEALRVLSGRLADDRTVAIAAIRPAGAEGHGEEIVAGAIGDAEGAFERLVTVLLSTEHGPDGLARRIGLELYRGGDEMPLRLAGNASASRVTTEGGVERRRFAADLRLGEEGGGVAVYEVLARA